jgi:glutamate--cysteine ligase
MFSTMNDSDHGQLSRRQLLDYLLQGAKPRERWQVGMELEKMGRQVGDGRPIPFEGEGASVLKALEFFLEHRGGDPVYEADNLIGVDAPWGAISLEPGGQVEWSSRPQDTLAKLRLELESHLATMAEAGARLGIDWLDVAVDPVNPVEAMPWMPKARYRIMRPFLGARGRLAHRMMTQSASIQCAFDFQGAEDWARKFKAAALMTPLAVALFANSSRIDGDDSGHRSYREIIWRETDPARCGLPEIVFQPGFSLESWLEWILRAPTIFRHRSRGMVPTGGIPFIDLLGLKGCDAVRLEDWESHLSTIFTEVRSYHYIEVRSADLMPDGLAMAVPVFWTGVLYHEDALEGALQLGRPLDDHAAWLEAMESAARLGTGGEAGGRPLREMAREALALSRSGLLNGAACAGDGKEFETVLDELAIYRRLQE